jgi:hypothetical protein
LLLGVDLDGDARDIGAAGAPMMMNGETASVTCSGGGDRVGSSRRVGRAVELQVIHTILDERDVGLDGL